VLEAIPGDLEDRDPANQAALYDHPAVEAEDLAKIRLLAGFYPPINDFSVRKTQIPPVPARRGILAFRTIPLPPTPAAWMGNTIEDEAPEFGHNQVATALPERPQPSAVEVEPPVVGGPPVAHPVAPVVSAPPTRALSPIEEAALKAVANDDVMYYHPKRGDKLGQLSERFNVPIEAIRIANGLPVTATTPTLGVFLKLPDYRKYYDPAAAENNR
jgi:hypothetical protein